jgi:sugar phosphate isomerase/epimerase
VAWKISGFGDEISDKLTTQLQAIALLGGDALEPRRVQLPAAATENIVALDDSALRTMKAMLDDHGMACSQIGSPVGKAPLGSELQEQLDQLDGAMRAAHTLDTPYVRVFGFQADAALEREAGLQTAIDRFRALAEHAAGHDPAIRLSLENEHDLYGATPEECARIIDATETGNVSMCFDPGNFVRAGVRPFDDGWELLAPHTRMLHIKDCRAADDAWVPAGEGDGQLGQILEAADPSAIAYLSLEPHLANSSWGEGRTRSGLWAEAYTALQGLLQPS